MEYKNIVLVGGSGLIGESIARFLIKKSKKVFVIDKVKPKNKGLIYFKSYKSDKANITKTLRQIVKKAKVVHAIINCAYPLTKYSYLKEQKVNKKKLLFEFDSHFGFFYNYTKVYLDYFLNKKFGQIINFS